MPSTDPDFRSSPLRNDELDALVAAASPQDAQRALRIVLGSELACWERDLRSGNAWYSPRLLTVLGLPPTQEPSRIDARIHPQDRAQFEHADALAMAAGGSCSFDLRHLDAHGSYRWARVFVRVWTDERDLTPLHLVGTMIDVHAERQARLDADRHAQRYLRALDAASEAHFERSAGQDDFSVSENLPQLLGHPPGTPAPDARTFLEWVHPDDRETLKAAVDSAWAAPGPWAVQYRLRCADGDWRWFRGRGRTAPDAQGVLRMSGMIGDVHQLELDRRELDDHRRRLHAMVAERTVALDAALDEAQRQRVQAESASKVKSEFLAHMSHELRTPLNGLLGLTELALKVAEQPAQRRYLEVALQSGRALLQLINEVLDLSRLDAGGLELAPQPFDLPELLAEIVRSLMPGVGSKPVSLHFDWIGDQTRVLGDPARVRQVVTNLVANAIKFTAQGQVRLWGEMQGRSAQGVQIVIHVEDTGPGIAPAQQERIFEAFVQADASLTRQHGGSGLGLAIARRMARAMGGDVALERSDAGGSAFVFAWPALCVADAPVLQPPPPGLLWVVNHASPSGPWFQRRIVRLGWRAEVLDSVAEAIERARAIGSGVLPDVVAISYQALLPDIDLAALRAVLPRAHIALMVRPDWDQPAIEAAALAQGAVPMVLPMTPQALHDLLSARPRAEPSRAAAAAAPLHGARVLVVEDNAVNLMITEEFVRQIGYEPVGVGDGQAAIDACCREAPQLVLMDLQMPLMDGLETTRRLRALQDQGRLPRFPIIALTAHAGDADRLQGRSAGMDDFLTKPILLDALRAAVQRWLV